MKTEDAEKIRARSEGVEARRNGIPRIANPYEKYSVKHEAWNDGYDFAFNNEVDDE